MTKGISATVGLEVGDRSTHACVLDEASGEVLEEGVVNATRTALRDLLGKLRRCGWCSGRAGGEAFSFHRGVSKRVEFDLLAAVPGDFEGPATSAYVYYGDDLKHWTKPLSISIAPR